MRIGHIFDRCLSHQFQIASAVETPSSSFDGFIRTEVPAAVQCGNDGRGKSRSRKAQLLDICLFLIVELPLSAKHPYLQFCQLKKEKFIVCLWFSRKVCLRWNLGPMGAGERRWIGELIFMFIMVDMGAVIWCWWSGVRRRVGGEKSESKRNSCRVKNKVKVDKNEKGGRKREMKLQLLKVKKNSPPSLVWTNLF